VNSLTIVDKVVERLSLDHDRDSISTVQGEDGYGTIEEVVDSSNIPENRVIVFSIKVDSNQTKELINQIRDKRTKVCVFLTADENDPLMREKYLTAVNWILSTNNRIDSTVREFTLIMNEGDSLNPVEADRALEIISQKLLRNSNCETSLTRREVEIMNFLSRGLLYKEIAHGMGISIQTVKSHLKHIYPKLRVNNRTEATLKYLHNT